MPYDRKTELLWNYIGMAQFSDFSRIWEQGPASIQGVDSSSGFTPQTVVIRAEGTPDSDDGKAPASPDSASDLGSPPGSGSEGVTSPVTDNGALESPVKIDIATFIPGSSGSHSSHPADMPVFFGEVSVYSEHVRMEVEHYFHTSTSAQSNTHSSLPENGMSDGAALSADDGPAKIYGPSDVATHAAIDGGDNTQTSNVVVEGNPDAAPTGWMDVGSNSVDDIISQLTAASQHSGHGFIIDYVSGNLTSLSSIQQLNTIYSNDVNQISSQASAPQGSLLGDIHSSEGITSGGNSNTNSAYLQGDSSLDNYDVLVVKGDLTEINKIIQVNLIVDSDVNQATESANVNMPYGTASSVWDAAIKSGGNTELNLSFIVDHDDGHVYLVGGHYGTSTSVTQTNMLSDSDVNDILQLFHSQEGTGFLGFDVDGVITSGGNSQTNTANLIGDDGSTSSSGLPDSAQHDLTSLLAFANLHPENGDIHVLYVDGNYTIVNLVVQINVIQDSDTNILQAHADGAMGSLTDPTPVVPASTDGDGTTTTTDGNHQDTDANGNAGDQGTTAVADGSSSGQDHSTDPVSADASGQDGTGTDTTAAAAGAGGTDSGTTGTNGTASTTGAAGTSNQSGTTTGTESATGTASANDHPGDSTTAGTASTAGTGSSDDHPSDSGTSGQGGTDSQLPVYSNSGSLHYDQLIDSGSNGATNVAVIADGSSGPQLRIVEGHYYEYNSIDQINILVDADHNHITAAMNTDVPSGEAIASDTTDPTHLTSADDVLNRMTG